MVYTRTEHRIEFFAYHKWVDSPASMLYPLLVHGLERSRRFDMVLPAHASGRGNLRLDTELIQLRQRFSGNDSRLELVVRARLFAGEQMLAARVFRMEEDAGSGPESGVDAANRASGRLVNEIVAWLDALLPESHPACRR
jgi:ABC-type uncharacterized transport system auxiliary subunit